MKRAKSRIDRLFRKTHTFVPKRILQTISEYDIQQLAAIAKKDDLERRVADFGALISRVDSSSDPAATAELQQLWWDDEEARLTYYIRLREGLPEIPGRGLWFENSTAARVLLRGIDSKTGLERLENERKKDKGRV